MVVPGGGGGVPDERGEDGDFVLRAGVAAFAGAEELAVDDSAHFLLLSPFCLLFGSLM